MSTEHKFYKHRQQGVYYPVSKPFCANFPFDPNLQTNPIHLIWFAVCVCACVHKGPAITEVMAEDEWLAQETLERQEI